MQKLDPMDEVSYLKLKLESMEGRPNHNAERQHKAEVLHFFGTLEGPTRAQGRTVVCIKEQNLVQFGLSGINNSVL